MKYFEIYAVNKDTRAAKNFEVIARGKKEAISEFKATHKDWTIIRIY